MDREIPSAEITRPITAFIVTYVAMLVIWLIDCLVLYRIMSTVHREVFLLGNWENGLVSDDVATRWKKCRDGGG